MSVVQVAPTVTRPAWVRNAIADLTNAAAEIQVAQELIEKAAMRIRNSVTTSVSTQPLVDAHHEAEHVWQHLVSVRRGLRMAWPDGDAEDRE